MTVPPTSPRQPDADEGSRTIVGIALVGFPVVLGMMLVPLPLTGRAGAAIGDIAHAPMFGGITLAVLFLWYRLRPLAPPQRGSLGRGLIRRLAIVGGCLFLLGILIEFAQMMTGRDASLHDAIANGLGIAAAVAVCFAVFHARAHPDRLGVSVLAGGLAVLLLGLATVRPLRILLDTRKVQQSFPLLASFEDNMELSRWYFDDCRGEYTDQNVTHGRRAMRVFLDRAAHPSATLIETVSDWSAVQSLELDITLAHSYPAPLQVVLKVIDQDHKNYDTDTARKSFWLQPGELTHLSFQRADMIAGPDTRRLDLSRIKFVSLLARAPETATLIDVDRLEVTR